MDSECTATAWGRTKRCQSWTGPPECLESARHHLKTSGLHFHHSIEDIERALLSATVSTEELPSHWFDKPSDPSYKKQKKEQDDWAWYGGEENVAAVAAVDAVHAIEASPELRPPQPVPSKAPSKANVQTVRGSSSSSNAAAHILVSRELLVGAVEEISRTSDTLKKAETLFDGAITAFRLEQKRLNELETLIRRSMN
jgi:hypothetical protein